MTKLRPGFLGVGAFITALITFLIFYTARDNQFVALDDLEYIVLNTRIETFGWDTVLWSLSSFYLGNWHPLAMISLALDRCIWGLNPYGFHLTNIVIHCCTVFCACYLFSTVFRAANYSQCAINTTSHTALDMQDQPAVLSPSGIIIGSIAAALLFGLHPLRVESVVWASERKDVLCMFFMTTSIWMYIRYAVRRFTISELPYWRSREYSFALFLAMLAQMSKPTAVSLPLILCIVDWYPLKRITDTTTLIRSLSEKIPFIVVSVVGTVLTLFAQQIAMVNAPKVDLFSRLLIACKALLFYLAATAYPSGLTAYYIHPGKIGPSELPEYLVYATIVISISSIIFLVGRKHPEWPAFWLYYVISLTPMLGLVQVGGQWAADRYSYLPSLGIALLWGGLIARVHDRIRRGNTVWAARLFIVFACAQLLYYSVLTLRQIPVWRTTETLATRIIEEYPHRSGAPYLARANFRNLSGRYEDALADIGEAMRISLGSGLTNTYPEIAYEQAAILKNLGRYSEAAAIAEWGVQVSTGPASPDVLQLRYDLKTLAAGKHSGKQ
jgi:hypothetical protein